MVFSAFLKLFLACFAHPFAHIARYARSTIDKTVLKNCFQKITKQI